MVVLRSMERSQCQAELGSNRLERQQLITASEAPALRFLRSSRRRPRAVEAPDPCAVPRTSQSNIKFSLLSREQGNDAHPPTSHDEHTFDETFFWGQIDGTDEQVPQLEHEHAHRLELTASKWANFSDKGPAAPTRPISQLAWKRRRIKRDILAVSLSSHHPQLSCGHN